MRVDVSLSMMAIGKRVEKWKPHTGPTELSLHSVRRSLPIERVDISINATPEQSVMPGPFY